MFVFVKVTLYQIYQHLRNNPKRSHDPKKHLRWGALQHSQRPKILRQTLPSSPSWMFEVVLATPLVALTTRR